MPDNSAGEFRPFRSPNLEARLRSIEDHLVSLSVVGERDEVLSGSVGGNVVIVSGTDGENIPEDQVDFDDSEGHAHDGVDGGKYVTLRAIELGTTVGSPADGAVVVYDSSTTDYEAANYTRGQWGVFLTAAPTANLDVGASAGGANEPPFRINAGSNTTVPVEGAFEYDGTRLHFTAQADRRTIQLSSSPKVTTTTVTNTVTPTTVCTGTIDANSLDAQQHFILTLCGRYTTANGVDTFTLQAKFGNVNTIAFTSTAGVVTDAPVLARFIGTVRSTGGAGEIWATLEADVNNVSKTQNNTAVTVIDFGIDLDPLFEVTWSNADAGNFFRCDQAWVEVLN